MSRARSVSTALLMRTTHLGSAVVAMLLALAMTTFAPSSWAEGATQPAGESTDVSPEIARKAASIARQTMSPFCPGRTLSDCPSPNAADWRHDIRLMLERGMTASEIQIELQKRAGGDLTGIPNRESSYALPIGLATGAALVLYFVFARLRRKDDVGDTSAIKRPHKGPQKPETEPPPVDDKRLDEELDSEE